MTTLKIFTVTKDEYDLIEDFIIYHASIVGFENIVIIDNMSSDERVLNIYKKYNQVKIHYETGYQNFKQGEHFTKYMNMYKHDAKYLIGMDTDEFIYILDENGNPTNKMILEYLETLPHTHDMFSIKYYDYSIPNINSKDYINYKHERPSVNINRFARKNENHMINKLFFRGSNFLASGCGNHDGKTVLNAHMMTNIGYLHFNNTGKQRSIERARNICAGYDFINVNDSEERQLYKLEPMILSNYTSIGNHRVKEIYYFYRKKSIIDLFDKYIKRLPNKDELNYHTYDKVTMQQKIMEFIKCDEAFKNRNVQTVEYNERQLIDLIYEEDLKDSDTGFTSFYDPMTRLTLNLEIKEINFLIDFFKSIDCK